MTVLVEDYWREISAGLAFYGLPVRHFVLYAEQETLRARILRQHAHSPFRVSHLEPYAEATRAWLHAAAEVVDTTELTSAQTATLIAAALAK